MLDSRSQRCGQLQKVAFSGLDIRVSKPRRLSRTDHARKMGSPGAGSNHYAFSWPYPARPLLEAIPTCQVLQAQAPKRKCMSTQGEVVRLQQPLACLAWAMMLHVRVLMQRAEGCLGLRTIVWRKHEEVHLCSRVAMLWIAPEEPSVAISTTGCPRRVRKADAPACRLWHAASRAFAAALPFCTHTFGLTLMLAILGGCRKLSGALT